MPKQTNDMATLESYSKYDPKGAKVRKHGGNKAIHDGVVSSGSKYPKGGSMDMAHGKTGMMK